MLEVGTELLSDTDFEKAKAQGYLVEAREGVSRIYGPVRVTAYSTDHVTLGSKKMHRSRNHFVVVEKSV